MSNTVAVIQCRLGSSRFPQKALALLDDKPIIWHVVQQARKIQGLDQVIVAVPNSTDATAIAHVLPRVVPVVWFPGVTETNLLGRFLTAARAYDADPIMRITGDCPRIDPALSSRVLARFKEGGVDYVSNPGADGREADTEVFSLEALERAERKAFTPEDKEHVGKWMSRFLRCATVPASRPKHSIDTWQDLRELAS